MYVCTFMAKGNTSLKTKINDRSNITMIAIVQCHQ